MQYRTNAGFLCAERFPDPSSTEALPSISAAGRTPCTSPHGPPSRAHDSKCASREVHAASSAFAAESPAESPPSDPQNRPPQQRSRRRRRPWSAGGLRCRRHHLKRPSCHPRASRRPKKRPNRRFEAQIGDCYPGPPPATSPRHAVDRPCSWSVWNDALRGSRPISAVGRLLRPSVPEV